MSFALNAQAQNNTYHGNCSSDMDEVCPQTANNSSLEQQAQVLINQYAGQITDYRLNPASFSGKEYRLLSGKIVSYTTGKNSSGFPDQDFLVSVVSLSKAKELFNSIMNTGKVPYAYPEDGCQFRAHQWSFLLAEKGYLSGKMFVSGDLTFTSGSRTYQWGYHTAPFLLVKQNGSLVRYMFDPTMNASGPIKYQTWKNNLFRGNINAAISSEVQTPMQYLATGDYEYRNEDWKFFISDHICGGFQTSYRRESGDIEPYCQSNIDQIFEQHQQRVSCQ